MRNYKFFLILIPCYLLSACFGAGTVTGKIQTWDVNDSARFGLCPIAHEKMIVPCPVEPIANTMSPIEITPEILVGIWGQPNKQKLEDGVRILIYRHGIAWRGLTVFVVVPLPLLLPLGHNDAIFKFRNNRLVRVEYTYNELDAAICGLYSTGPNGIGCIAHWH